MIPRIPKNQTWSAATCPIDLGVNQVRKDAQIQGSRSRIFCPTKGPASMPVDFPDASSELDAVQSIL
jgi:hypothetical protein